MEDLLHFSITVSGRVQGVGYRAFTLKNAAKLNVKGFVKNLADGTVHIEAEQTREVLKVFLEICKNGPGWGRVDRLEYFESPVEGFKDFRIKY